MKRDILDWKTSSWSSWAYQVFIDWPWYFNWQTVRFIANHTNTWAATLSISWKDAISIKKRNDIALVAWDIEQWQIVLVAYNEADNVFEILSEVWNTIKSNDIDEWVLQVSTTTITSEQVLALNATPIELLAAPWAWKVIIVDKITATIDYNTTAYATNTTLEFRYWTATTKVSADITSLLTATADKATSVWWIETLLVNAINDSIKVNIATWEATAWDSPIKITTVYRVLSI